MADILADMGYGIGLAFDLRSSSGAEQETTTPPEELPDFEKLRARIALHRFRDAQRPTLTSGSSILVADMT